jgi:hypothetical protein
MRRWRQAKNEPNLSCPYVRKNHHTYEIFRAVLFLTRYMGAAIATKRFNQFPVAMLRLGLRQVYSADGVKK